MKRLLSAFLLCALGCIDTRAAAPGYVPFRADLTAGAACTIDARALHPTQAALGWREVLFKRAKLDAKDAAALAAYLQDKDVPIVIGPGGVPFMADGHHTIRALLESQHADKTVYAHVFANWSALAPAAFWARMQASNYTYLKDAAGRPVAPDKLPATLLEMQRDPWRGLAWALMDAGAFTELKGVFFQEFLWADFLRERVQWNDADEVDFQRALAEARRLAATPAAAALPGWKAGVLSPRVVTEPVQHDTDDPAIWINPADPAQSLIVGTDKDTDGALYVFDLHGKIVRRVPGLKRPNNVDIADGFRLGGRDVAIAVTTEREEKRLRIFTLPEMTCVDKGDLVVFDGDPRRAPMGIALYRRPRDGAMFAFVGGKSGPAQGYIGQYRLEDDGSGHVKMTLVRQFGAYSGKKEIEAIAVDAELGYVYYSDEQFGVRKYAADPDAPDAGRELACFAKSGFAGDHEGISIWKRPDGTGYVIVSDQQANKFWLFPREGAPGHPHEHRAVKIVDVAAIESDGSDVTAQPLGELFPHGLFVAMSNGRVFHYYGWEQIAGADLPAPAK
ncbi:MAG: phytase [Candidatus Didemnitutus sp.]|nr:phytase [Candidatus Didemnitutus sp.]